MRFGNPSARPSFRASTVNRRNSGRVLLMAVAKPSPSHMTFVVEIEF